MAIIYFILILGITVFIHELGHFMFAKKYGVYVYEFSIGMGPRLFKFNRKNDETDYCIRLFPIGGYVQMAGEEVEVDEKVPKEKNLQSKKAFQRFMIMVAGVMMNFLLAIVLLFFVALFNGVSLDNVYITNNTLEGIADSDKIVAIDGHFVNNYDKLNLELAIVDDNQFTVTVKSQDGNQKDALVNPVKVGESGLVFGYDYGFEVENLKVKKSDVANIKEESKIISINGITINDYYSLLSILKENKTSKFTISLEDVDGSHYTTTIIPVETSKDSVNGYSYGFFVTGKEAKGLFAAIKYAILKFFSSIEQMIFTVFYLITGKISLGMLSGPLGVYSVVSEYSKYGISNIISLLCLICINVGFVNLLPLPAFDGGHILFIIIEKIKGSKVNPKVENTIHNIGFILLMILMVLVTYNDIIKLF